MRIDLVSDVVCPWCIVGYKQLEAAMERVADELEVELHWHPFQLNPDMVPEGENLRDHIARKYGSPPEASKAARARLTEVGSQLGFQFRFTDESRIYNTFDAHRLIAWAKTFGAAAAHRLEMACFDAYFSRGEDISRYDVLLEVVKRAELDADAARSVLTSDAHAEAVQEEIALWQSRGISAVPAFVLNERYLVSGAQGTDALEAALREAGKEDG